MFLSGPTALLSFIMFLQTNVYIHVHSPPLSAQDFSRVLSGWVKSLWLLLNRHMQETSHSICHNRFLIFSSTSSSGISIRVFFKVLSSRNFLIVDGFSFRGPT